MKDLKKSVMNILNQRLDFDGLIEEASEIIKSSVDHSNPDLLDSYLGKSAYDLYATDSELADITIKVKAGEYSPVKSMHQYFISMLLRLGLYYACQQGSLVIAKYFIENQRMPGDLLVRLDKLQNFLDSKEEMIGPPLKLAAKSNNFELVKYLYENTEAMVETTFGQPEQTTPLMHACKNGNRRMVEYFLKHGANPNAEVFAKLYFAKLYKESPLSIAIIENNPAIISILIKNRAIVTSYDINKAIKYNVAPYTIQLLMQHCVNSEDPYNPYLLSAIQSGNIELLHLMEKNDLVKSWDEISDYADTSIESSMLTKAAKSGSISMMRYLVDNNKIDMIKHLQPFADICANDPSEHSFSYRKGKESDIWVEAAFSNSVELMTYLFKHVPPSPTLVKKICAHDIENIQMVAYLHSLLATETQERQMLESIAFNLKELSLGELFKIYNTKFVYIGNNNTSLTAKNYLDKIALCIEKQAAEINPQDLFCLIKNNKQIAAGALFYYCSSSFHQQSERLVFLLKECIFRYKLFPSIDVTNYLGDTLAKFSAELEINNATHQLLLRGANADAPNHKGETLINTILDCSYRRDRELNSILDYFPAKKNISYSLPNTLIYETKRSLGGHEGIETILKLSKGKIGDLSLKSLIMNCLDGRNSNRKMKALFVNLSEKYIGQVTNLLKDNDLLAEISEAVNLYYFPRFMKSDLTITKQNTQGITANFFQAVKNELNSTKLNDHELNNSLNQ